MKYLNIFCGFLLVVVFMSGRGLSAEPQAAPDFRIRDINKQWIRLSELTAKGPVILNFWALWCVPCRKELPHLETLYQKYQNRGLNILAVNQDDISSEAKVRPFVRGNRFSFPVVIDAEKEIYRLYKVSSLPTLILIDE